MDLLFWVWFVIGYGTLVLILHNMLTGRLPAGMDVKMPDGTSRAPQGSPYRAAMIMPGLACMMFLAVAGADGTIYAELNEDRALSYVVSENATRMATIYTVYDPAIVNGTITLQPMEVYAVWLPPPAIWGIWHYAMAALMSIYVLVESLNSVFGGSRKR